MAESEPNDRLQPGLYIVATPIGNLGDITFRAAETLGKCDVIACEDTRVTGKLLNHLGLRKPMWRYDDHADEKDRERLLEAMRDRAVALTSDAGTPLVSDPGYRLVREARERDIPVTTLPGPVAAIAGLTLSGLPNDRFLFAGFLPHKDKARIDVLRELASIPATLIFYETAPRLVKSLDAIHHEFGTREVSVARELTKRFEECRTGSASDLASYYTANPPKGEIVLLVAPPERQVAENYEVDELLVNRLTFMKPSQAASEVAMVTGRNRKELYARAMELKNNG